MSKQNQDWIAQWKALSTRAKVAFIIAALAFFGWLVGDSNCGCSDHDLVELQRELAISRSAAKEICCEWSEY